MPIPLVAALAALTTISGGADSSRFDHGRFDRLLHDHVRNGMVDYDAFAAAPDFGAYLAALAGFNPSNLPRDEQLAFWINAYNAYTIQLIVAHRERKSIRNINKKFWFIRGSGPWAEKLVVVGGTTYDLETVEQQIIRPTFGEPRIHFALVCAAMGCPPLRAEAYSGAALDRQLEDQARIFLTDSPSKNRIDVAARTVWASQVFEFNDYIKDFGGSPEAAMRFIGRYYPQGAERTLLESGTAKFEYTDYDWTLNSQEQARRQAKKADR